MSANTQSTTCHNLTNQCEICGSPLALVADEQTMLGTLECPACCCDEQFAHQFDVEIDQSSNGKALFVAMPLYLEIEGELRIKREAIYRLSGSSQLCCEFLVEQLEKRKRLIREGRPWRGYGTNRKDRHSHFRRSSDGSWNMYAHYLSPSISFVFRMLPGTLSDAHLTDYFRLVIPAIRKQLEQFETTKR